MLSERQALILEAAVREFIETGEPVSSGLLFEHHRFGIRPAMIRLELNDLADAGYLEQPHHSAGRVPTDRGFEFFANRAVSRDAAVAGEPHLTELFEEGDWAGLTETLAERLGMLGVTSDIGHDAVYKGGLEHLIEHIEWQSRDMLTSVIRDFEGLDRRLGCIENLFDDDELKVFIGKKSPVTRCPELAVVAAQYDTDGQHVTVFAIGPKRMDYRKAARVLKGLKKQKIENGK